MFIILFSDIDECQGNVCHHGTCTDGIAAYSCSCHAGYIGRNCDKGCITLNQTDPSMSMI